MSKEAYDYLLLSGSLPSKAHNCFKTATGLTDLGNYIVDINGRLNYGSPVYYNPNFPDKDEFIFRKVKDSNLPGHIRISYIQVKVHCISGIGGVDYHCSSLNSIEFVVFEHQEPSGPLSQSELQEIQNFNWDLTLASFWTSKGSHLATNQVYKTFERIEAQIIDEYNPYHGDIVPDIIHHY